MISTAELAPHIGPARLNELMDLDALAHAAKEELDAATSEHKAALAALEECRLQASGGNILERGIARSKLAGLLGLTEEMAATLRTAQQRYDAAAWKSHTLRDSLVHAHRRLQGLDSENMPPAHRERARAKLLGVLGLEQARELA